MEEKHFIAIIAIIFVLGFVLYAAGNIDIGNIGISGSGNENNESTNNIWNSSQNVKITSEGDGTHMKGINDKSCWFALTCGDEQLFINSKEDFTIDMDAKIDNTLAIYLFTSHESNGNTSIVPTKSNDFQHLQFNYSSSNNTLTYSVNGNIVKTMDCDFEGKPVGFKIVDWQGDMDVFIRNMFVINH